MDSFSFRRNQYLKRKTKVLTASDFGLTGGAWQSIGGAGLTNADALVSPYSQDPTVFSCIRAKATAVLGAPFHVMKGDPAAREGGTPLDERDDWSRLFARPDPRHIGPEWWAEQSSWTDLEGEFFAIAFADGSRFAGKGDQVRELLLINPRCAAEVIDTRTDRVSFWQVGDGTRYFTIPAESVWHYKTFNPLNRHRGQSSVQAAYAGMRGNFRGDQLVTAMAENGSLPGLVVYVPDSMPEEKRRLMRESIETRHQGAARAARVMLTSNVNKLEVLKRGTYDEAGLAALKKDNAENICSVIGVTPWDIGRVNTTTYASAMVLDSWKWKHSILPWMYAVNESLRDFMGERWSNGRTSLWGMFDTRGVEALQAGLSDRLDNAKKYTELGYPTDHVNERLGLGMHEAATPLSREQAFDATALVAIASASAEGLIEPEQAVAIISAAFPGLPDPASIAGKGKTYTPPKPTVTAPGAKPVAAKSFAPEDQADESELVVDRAIQDAFGQCKADTLAALFSANPSDFATPKAWTKAVNPLAQLVSDTARWKKNMAGAVRPAVERARRIVARDAGLELQASAQWDDPRFRKAAAKRIAQMVDIAPKYRKKLAQRIASTIRQNGFDVRAVEDVINAEFDDYITTNAATIARTEVGMLREGMRATIANDNGYRSKTWQLGACPNHRASHIAVHGENVAIEAKFSNGLDHPLQVGAPAEEVINCCCTARYLKNKPA